MPRLHPTATFAPLIAVLGLGAASFAQQDRAALAGANGSAPVTSEVLRRAGTAADPMAAGWLSYGKTQGESRYSPLQQIDATNAKDLALAWSYVMGAGGGNQEATPVVWNGTLYGITTWSVVFALDARTGKELWRWDPQVNQTTVRPVICCGNVNRGVAIYNGTIIAPAIDGRLFALKGRASDMVDPNCLTALARAQRRMGFKHGTALLSSDELPSPISCPLLSRTPRARSRPWQVLRPACRSSQASERAS